MIDDHHGRTAGRANLLVTAADEILGTHRVSGICPAGAGVRACSVAAVAVVSPQGTRRNDWDLPDPAGLTLDQVRPIGEDIERRVRILLAELTTAGTS